MTSQRSLRHCPLLGGNVWSPFLENLAIDNLATLNFTGFLGLFWVKILQCNIIWLFCARQLPSWKQFTLTHSVSEAKDGSNNQVHFSVMCNYRSTKNVFATNVAVQRLHVLCNICSAKNVCTSNGAMHRWQCVMCYKCSATIRWPHIMRWKCSALKMALYNVLQMQHCKDGTSSSLVIILVRLHF